jgi:multiple sugar transport system substrate-binding protein
LYSFGLGDLAGYCETHDLIIYDHPFVGEARSRGLLRDLAPLLSGVDRTAFAADSTGPSWQSYIQGDGIWALPIDTAAQTGVWRADLLDDAGEPVPETLDEVLALAARAARRGQWIAWPAIPTDQMCTLLTILASMGLDPGCDPGDFLDRRAAAEAVEWMRRILAVAHPASGDWNPIRCLDHMAAQDDVIYVPWAFNYVNYQAAAGPRRIRFGRSPQVGAFAARTILGGAGIGISARSKAPEAAFAYALHLSQPAYQSADYVRNGGQPGSRSAWQSPACNALTNGFFADTLPVLDASWLRPTYPGFLPIFHDATTRLAAVTAGQAPLSGFLDWINSAHDAAQMEAAR